MAVQVALVEPHLTGGGDRPACRYGPVFEDYAKSKRSGMRGLAFMPVTSSDPLPSADVLIMGHILHDWNLEEKLTLFARHHERCRQGGALIVHEAIIDDDRTKNASACS